MNNPVLTTIISSGCGILSIIISAILSTQLVNWRLNKLEEKVDKHNGYSDKIASIEKNYALQSKDIEYIKEQNNYQTNHIEGLSAEIKKLQQIVTEHIAKRNSK